jgi:hypothetical protein
VPDVGQGSVHLFMDGPVPEIIDPVFAKTSPNRSFCMTENERFGLVFVKTGSINSGTVISRVAPFICIVSLNLQKEFNA